MELWKWVAVAVALLVGGYLLLGLLAPPEPLLEEVTFANGEITLAGTLSLPSAGKGPHPAVILISGSGPQNRDEELPGVPGYRPFATIADYLSRRGIAVLRYDDRGVGGSTGDHATATSADFAADAEAALGYLLGREEIDPKWVGLLGHSEGGLIAAMIAARNPAVAFIVSMAGVAVDGYRLLLKQLERILEAEGSTEEEMATALEQQRTVMDLALAERWEEVETFLRGLILEQLQSLPEEQKAALGDLEELAAQQVTIQLAGLQSPWFRFFLSYDPRRDWERVKVPVLALFGGLDVQVDAAQNRVALEEALARAGNEDVTIVVFPTANHLFQAAETGSPTEYAALSPRFVPGFLETIAGWLRERVKAKE